MTDRVYEILSDADGNVGFFVEADSPQDAAIAALEELGYRVLLSEHEGWIGVDQDGNQLGSNGPDAVIVARGKPLMRCPKCGKPLVCAACAGSVGGAARVAKGFASAEVQAKAQATRKRKARAARNSHNPSRQAPAAQEAP